MARFLHIDTAPMANGKSRRLIAIAWLWVAIVVFLLAFTYCSISVLSAVRAYIGGESLWSKAQKDMVYSLARYARYHDQSYYDSYLQSLTVIHGDRQARLELEKRNPDLKIAAAGLIQGRNHPDDVDGMISLFRNFRGVYEINQAVLIWTAADADIDQLVGIAEHLHAALEAGTLDDAGTRAYLEQIFELNKSLVPREEDFSYTLGRAARKLQAVLLFMMFAVVSVLLLAAYLFSRRVVRQSERVQGALLEGEKQMRELLQFAPLPIVIVRIADEAIVYANDHALAQFKVAPNALHRLQARRFYVRKGDRNQLLAALRIQGSLRDREVLLRDTEGTPFWTLFSSQRISYNRQDCLLIALSNIDARKRAQQELAHRAFHDELTGLPNRAMFMDTLRNLLAKADPAGTAFAILFIDLDRFKLINDELGHETGDHLLQQVATRLADSVRQGDIVARLGGDEFVVLLENCRDMEAVARTAGKILNAMEPDYHLEGHVVNVTTSIGVSCYPQDGADLNTLVKNADVAMYRAKESGRNNAQFYGMMHHHHEQPDGTEGGLGPFP
ncbi:MAG: diguanylate cyclase [Burkholderiaceae bacterium]|nr:diguanylate cyclase [Burkholderiaceae bacterium]